MAASVINLNNSVPAALASTINVTWQKGTQTGTDPVSGYPIFPVSAAVAYMVGDSGSGGTAGVVPPAPAGSAAAGKFLKADGTFQPVVTSVAVAAPTSILTVSGSPITSAGTITLALATQSANLVWAGPATGAAATPTFRALVSADLPSGVGTVTSVALAAPSSILSVSGSPVTSAGTLTLALATQSANTVWSGPTTGSPATPTFRALAAADLPLATTGAFGAVKPDGSTITISAGVISSTGGGGGGGVTAQPVLRGTGAVQNGGGATTLVLSFTTTPAVAQTGDLAIISLATNSASITPPSGWTLQTSQVPGGIYWNGYTYSKVLTSGDISTGSATFGLGSSISAVGTISVFVAGTGAVREAESGWQGQATSLTVTVTTSAAVQPTDVGVYFGSNSLNFGTISQSASRGINDQAPAFGNYIARQYHEYLSVGGSYSVVFTSGSGATGFGQYGSIVIIQGLIVTAAVTSVTGVAPITSTGGSTPAIGINLATTLLPGAVQPDGSTITISGGIISAAAASSSVNPFGLAFTAPPAPSALTWVNQGGATASTQGTSLFMQAPANSGDQIRFLRRSSYPSTPYTFTVAINPSLFVANYGLVGIAVSDGTKLITFGVGYSSGVATNVPSLSIYNWANTSTNNSGLLNVPILANSQYWLRITDNGTNLVFSFSFNGYDFTSLPATTVSRTAWMSGGPSQVGVFVDANNASNGCSCVFMSWTGI